MVTTENYEEYMMMDADGELDAAGQAALQDFIEAHPALQEEYAAWKTLKLQPVNAPTYPDKEALMQREPKGRVIGLRPIALAAAAAVLAAVIFIPALLLRVGEGPAIVHEFSVPEPAVPVKDYYADSLSKIGVFSPEDKPRPTTKPGLPTERSRIAKQIPQLVPIAIVPGNDSLIALHAVSPHPFSENGLEAPLEPIGEGAVIADVQSEIPQSEAPRQARITLAPENRQAFQLLKQAFEARVAQASATAKSIQETALIIKLGNGSININL